MTTVTAPAREYTIAGGSEESGRLAAQAGVMSGATARLLDEIGVAAGWSCLDVGCGDGQVSVGLAERVGPTGCVVGVDLSADAVAHATSAAAAAGATVARFLRADAYELPFVGRFDLAYARLVLTHLDEPVAVLREMAASVAVGGVVAVEDLFADTLSSEPATAALADLRRIYAATVRAHGGDPTIGPRLPALFRRAGLVDVRSTPVVNRMRTTEEKQTIVDLMDTMRVAMVASGAATDAEVDRVRAAVAAAADDPHCTFLQAQITQTWGRRT